MKDCNINSIKEYLNLRIGPIHTIKYSRCVDKVDTEYNLHKQNNNMRDSDKMKLAKPVNYAVFLEICDYYYNSNEAILIDTHFKNLLAADLGYSRGRYLNKIISELDRLDFIGHINGKIPDLYLINPIICFKGNFLKDYKNSVDNYYSLLSNKYHSFEDKTRDTTVLLSHLEYLKKSKK